MLETETTGISCQLGSSTGVGVLAGINWRDSKRRSMNLVHPAAFHYVRRVPIPPAATHRFKPGPFRGVGSLAERGCSSHTDLEWSTTRYLF